jgi:hypothetical protein
MERTYGVVERRFGQISADPRGGAMTECDVGKDRRDGRDQTSYLPCTLGRSARVVMIAIAEEAKLFEFGHSLGIVGCSELCLPFPLDSSN